jgi:ubiquinone/menaquinone biosynthesis C-methylase UbiE
MLLILIFQIIHLISLSVQPFKPLTQMCKVLKSGGNALIADINTPVSNQQKEDYIERIKAKGMDKL